MLVLATRQARERTRIAAWQTLGDTLKPSSQSHGASAAMKPDAAHAVQNGAGHRRFRWLLRAGADQTS
jgi:hypothetical protein